MKLLGKDLKVLFEDNHLFIVSKPSGVITQASEKDTESLESYCKKYIKIRDQKPAGVFLQPIHRLDKPVSGIVIFAKTKKALSRLCEQMRDQKIEKTYLAVVEGILEPRESTLVNYLQKSCYRSNISYSETVSKRAELSYVVKKTLKDTSIVEIKLKTGRYHQIRVQFAHNGHPVVGDLKYGSKIKTKKLKLHHIRVLFMHPVTKEQIICEDKSIFAD